MSDEKKKMDRREFLHLLGNTSLSAAALGVSAAKASGSDLESLEARVALLEKMMLDNSFKEALLQFARKVAYIDAGGPAYYQELAASLHAKRTLQSISAALATENHAVREGDGLDSLRPYLTVTACYSDKSREIVSGYTLEGALVHGLNTITVSYGNKKTSFSVTAVYQAAPGYTKLLYVTANGKQYIDTGLTATEPASAEYEVLYTSVTEKGGHILSSDNTFFPFFRGKNESKEIHSSNWANKNLTSGSYSYQWELNRRYTIEAFPDIKINKKKIATLQRGHKPGSENFFLFAYGGSPSSSQYAFSGNLYYARIYGKDGGLLRDFVPCENDSGAVGLYDTVTDTFYTSDSDTALIAGEVE